VQFIWCLTPMGAGRCSWRKAPPPAGAEALPDTAAAITAAKAAAGTVFQM